MSENHLSNPSVKPFEKLQDFIEKVDAMKKQEKMDLSSDQDLSIAIMNLISIEEHFFFTGAKTGKNPYYDLIENVREIRKDLLKKIVKDPEGEIWCISKHLLAASMRVMECGTKQLSMNRKEDAYALFQKSYDLYCLFWGINLKAIDIGEVQKLEETAVNKKDHSPKNVITKLGSLVQKVVNCCLE